MALRGTASQANTSTANTCVVSVGSIGIQSGDTVVLAVLTGGSTSATLTSTGFSAATGGTGSGGGATFQALIKTAGGSEPSTYTVNSSVTDFMAVHCRVYSGRSGTVTTTATAFFDSSVSPLAFTSQTFAPAANDDVVFLGGIPAAGNLGTIAYTPGTGFANGSLSYAAVGFGSGILGSDYVNNPGGSAGFLGGSYTYTAGSGTSLGYFISLAAGGAPPPGSYSLESAEYF